jgi:hypothetical protein
MRKRPIIGAPSAFAGLRRSKIPAGHTNSWDTTELIGWLKGVGCILIRNSAAGGLEYVSGGLATWLRPVGGLVRAHRNTLGIGSHLQIAGVQIYRNRFVAVIRDLIVINDTVRELWGFFLDIRGKSGTILLPGDQRVRLPTLVPFATLRTHARGIHLPSTSLILVGTLHGRGTHEAR